MANIYLFLGSCVFWSVAGAISGLVFGAVSYHIVERIKSRIEVQVTVRRKHGIHNDRLGSGSSMGSEDVLGSDGVLVISPHLLYRQ